MVKLFPPALSFSAVCYTANLVAIKQQVYFQMEKHCSQLHPVALSNLSHKARHAWLSWNSYRSTPTLHPSFSRSDWLLWAGSSRSHSSHNHKFVFIVLILSHFQISTLLNWPFDQDLQWLLGGNGMKCLRFFTDWNLNFVLLYLQ